MTHASRSLLVIAALVLAIFSNAARAMEGAALERGTAIIDPFALRELDRAELREGLGLRRFIPTAPVDGKPILGDELFALASMAGVRMALDADFERYLARHKASLPSETIGVGQSFDWQMFDRELLYSARARFVLAGIVNRMDRAYVAPQACGEVRLIYRLTRLDEAPVGETANSPRLPMTLNVILRAKAAAPGGALSCKEIAQRWLTTADWPESGAELAKRLTAPGGPLELFDPSNIDRIETNLQIAHAPKSAVRDFRTDYLMKVFRYNAQTHAFDEAPMENQIDRDRILADDKLKADFKTWLLDPKNFGELDRGTLVIPDEFLAKSVIAPTPVGFVSSELQPAFGLVQGEGDHPVFSESDVVTALEKNASILQNIRSVAGFERRLNDIGCGGCHQTRGIGGFHFPGVDWMAAKPSNSTVVPASPHFFGDQVRRRDIVSAISDGRPPDFSRGFASRPQTRGTTELAGTEYEDGWGSHCYQGHDDAADNDKSFRGWSCAEGLSCQIANPVTRMGMCFIKTR
jgi:hypothetical protein